MRHVILTCKNHPNLRWSCKEVAWSGPAAATSGPATSQQGYYNGSRRLFFKGEPTGNGMYDDGSGLDCTQVKADGTLVEECDCDLMDLVIAPEDALVTR